MTHQIGAVRTRALVVMAAIAAGVAALQSTATTQAGPLVVGTSGAVSPIVSDLDKTLAFYQGVLGFKSDAPSTASAKDTPPPPILKLEGTPDARMRWSHVTLPGTSLWAEPLEFGDIDRTPVAPRIQDPGAATLILLVRNVDAVSARLKQAGTRVVTPGGVPVAAASGDVRNRAVLLAGPDGHLIELHQPDPVPERDVPGEVIGAYVRLTVANLDDTLRLYRDRLGLSFGTDRVMSDSAFGTLTGLDTPETKWATMAVAVSTRNPPVTIQMVEVNGVERRPLRTRIVDPGATRLMFMVRDLNAAVTAFTGSGGSIVSTDGQPVSLGRGAPYIVVRDLNNFFVILREQALR